MGWDYALVHVKYTIPPSLALTLLYWPLLSKVDVYKICFLVTIAIVSTIPWDSYLIRRRIWTYPEDAVLGPTFWSIPAEELFFFFIQTYGVSMLYLCLSKPVFHPVYLKPSRDDSVLSRYARSFSIAGQVILIGAIVQGVQLIRSGNVGTYLGLILVWACPFMLLLWSLSGDFLLRLPLTSTLVPILLPTLYLWVVDTFALRRGTWAIESGTKLGIHVWDGLEIEEAIFFLMTDVMVVFGLVAFDNTMAILYTFNDIYPEITESPSPWQAIRALLIPTSQYDTVRINGLREATNRLQRKSRSFFLASAAFDGRLRIDLTLLYSFCRVADDLIDNANSVAEAQQWITRLYNYIELAYRNTSPSTQSEAVRSLVSSKFPSETHLALLQLPVEHLSKQPLLDLLKGFEMDLKFSNASKTASKPVVWPIETEADLETYGAYVAGTVAQLCIDLTMHHYGRQYTVADRLRLKKAGGVMGEALQIVNIARDIAIDAGLSRVYIPTIWLQEYEMKPGDVIKDPKSTRLHSLRDRLLRKAFEMYKEARPAIEELPAQARKPMRVAIESYMEIGRVLQEGKPQLKRGRATVPIQRRLWVAWKALNKM